MKNKAPARLRKKHYFGRGAMFVLCAIFAVLFLLPTVLTITNSFMSEAEIKSNYGMIFATTSGGYVSKTVNLKFIPDKVSFSQYWTTLFASPEYLLKFWNSVILVVPIVLLHAVAIVIATTLPADKGVCPFPLCRGHAVKGIIRLALYGRQALVDWIAQVSPPCGRVLVHR